MAPSKASRHRFQNSLDMVAARSVTFVDLTQPSGTDNAWSMVDSPTLGRMSCVSPIESAQNKSTPAPIPRLAVNVAPLEIRKANVTPLDIKKIRRRGFTSNVQLVLPPSPLPTIRSPLGMSQMHSPQSAPTPQSALTPQIALTPRMAQTPKTALTFTAEWDLTERTFVFTPFESSYPPSAISPYFDVSPVPDDVRSVTDLDARTVIDPEEFHAFDVAPPSPSSSISTPCSEIFDRDYESVFSHFRKMSTSTSAPSSAAEPHSKCDMSSTSLTKQMTIHLFEEELNRTLLVEGLDRGFDKSCYEEMDEDLLMAPMDVFERLLWESTDPEEPIIPEEAVVSSRSSISDKTIPDVPRNPSLESMPLSDEGSHSRSLSEGLLPSTRSPPKTRRKRKFSEDFVGGLISKC